MTPSAMQCCHLYACDNTPISAVRLKLRISGSADVGQTCDFSGCVAAVTERKYVIV